MKVILSHPTGNANVRTISQALAEANLLGKFYTCVAVYKNTFLFQLSRFKPFRELQRRFFPQVLRGYTNTRPLRELGRIGSQKFGWQKALVHEKGVFCIDKVYEDLDFHVSRNLKQCAAVYAYEDGALQSFENAKRLRVHCLYDLPTGYWRAHREYLEEERKRLPEWGMTLKGFKDSERKLHKKDQEIFMADAIFVASSFTRDTLKFYPGTLPPIHLVPYGFPEVKKNRVYRNFHHRKIKILFVGGLSQLKGIANVLAAADFYRDFVDLTIVGRKLVEGCIPLEEGLAKHTWIPSLPHEEVLKLMSCHDLFVFPSLFEGYGLVIAEAMSQGTPVLTTNRTCGADFIKDGENGWFVDAGETGSLIRKIGQILSNPECISRVGKEAILTAEQSPMYAYGEKMVEKIKMIIA